MEAGLRKTQKENCGDVKKNPRSPFTEPRTNAATTSGISFLLMSFYFALSVA